MRYKGVLFINKVQLREYLKKHQLLMDGAMGTYFASLTKEEKVLPESASLTNPELIRDIHLEYISAGARMIRTNTFATNTMMSSMSEMTQRKMIEQSCEIAKNAVAIAKQNGIKEDIYIAGSVGPIYAQAMICDDEVEKEYKRICNTFLQCGVDAICFETFDDLTKIVPVIQYIRKKSDVFIMTNFSLNKNGYTLAGVSAQRILSEAEKVEVIDACGFNCGIGSGHMKEIVKQLKLPKQKYLAILPNAGYPEQIHNRLVFLDNTKYFIENMKEISTLGINIIGGCCGTTPRYIQELNNHIEQQTFIRESIIEVKESKKEEKEVVTNPMIDWFSQNKKVIAVELDPPYDADCDKILNCAKQLKKADIITFADSPMGRSRVDSILMSLKIHQETGRLVMPHISCRDRNMISMRSTLLGAYIHGIRNCLFVTGDPVPSVSRVNTTGVFDYNSIQLMKFVREMNAEHFSSDPIIYGGALNHGRGIIEKVADRMKRKMDEGASYFMTQPIYCKEDIERIARLKELVDTKILCGIMPLTSLRNATFIKNEMTGIHVPDEIVARYSSEMSKEEAEWVGAEIASEIIAELSPIADGYYFMLPFNRISFMDKIQIK